MTANKGIGITELIEKIKQDLLIPQPKNEHSMFKIEEVVIEINFTVNAEIEGGFNLGVVTIGSKVDEEKIQKVTVKLSPTSIILRE